MTPHTNLSMHTRDSYSKGTLTPWKGLLIDQSALTAVWRELLTLWLQRVYVQWPCKGSLALTLGVSALPWRRWSVQTHTHTHAYMVEGLFTPHQSPSGMCSHRAVSVCIQSEGWDTGRFFLLWLCTGPVCVPAWLLPHSGHKVSNLTTTTSETLTFVLWYAPVISHKEHVP